MKKSQKSPNVFPERLIKEWENSDGVNFAIALAEISGWLISVDWWSPTDEDANVTDMIPIRVYVGTDSDLILDFKGIRRIAGFSDYVVSPLAVKRSKNRGGGMVSRYYNEEKLRTLPLRVKPSALGIISAKNAILQNRDFLNKIPKRLNSIPAYVAAQFTFGWCSVFAKAHQSLTNLPATAIIAKSYSERFIGSRLGFCHSVILHSDGDGEDAWGKQPFANILARYGVLEYELDESVQIEVSENLFKNSHDKYVTIYDLAITHIQQNINFESQS